MSEILKIAESARRTAEIMRGMESASLPSIGRQAEAAYNAGRQGAYETAAQEFAALADRIEAAIAGLRRTHGLQQQGFRCCRGGIEI